MISDGHATKDYAAVVMGASAGGFETLAQILGLLPGDFRLPVLIVQHLHSSDEGRFAEHLARVASIPVLEPCDKQRIAPGTGYIAPANYHMAVERDGTIALSVDAKVNWSRPSVDVLFESAARCWRRRLIAVILSGANSDGAEGMRLAGECGATLIAQDPATAAYPMMPCAAIEAAAIRTLLPPHEIAMFISGKL